MHSDDFLSPSKYIHKESQELEEQLENDSKESPDIEIIENELEREDIKEEKQT